MRMVTCTGNRGRMLCGVVVVSLVACSRSERRAGGDTTATSATAPAESATAAAGSAAPGGAATGSAATGARIAAAQKAGVGPYLTDGNGLSVYLFLKDRGDSSSCYDKCATSWPPVVATGQPAAADTAVQATLLGTSKRRDGATQVTYKGAPLYTYRDDKQPGDIKGQDKTEYGAKWYLVSPAGGKQEGKGTGSKRTP